MTVGGFGAACHEYWRLLEDAYGLGIKPPAHLWMVVCEHFGLAEPFPRSPFAGRVVCPECGHSQIYQIKPRVGFCGEWMCHVEEECLSFPIDVSWRPASITLLAKIPEYALFFDQTVSAAETKQISCVGRGLSVTDILKASQRSTKKRGRRS